MVFACRYNPRTNGISFPLCFVIIIMFPCVCVICFGLTRHCAPVQHDTIRTYVYLDNICTCMYMYVHVCRMGEDDIPRVQNNRWPCTAWPFFVHFSKMVDQKLISSRTHFHNTCNRPTFQHQRGWETQLPGLMYLRVAPLKAKQSIKVVSFKHAHAFLALISLISFSGINL